MQRVEIGIAIDASDDGLAIDDEMLLPVLQRASATSGKRLVQS
jgi:hypothetical protein